MRSIWFRDERDAMREKGIDPHDPEGLITMKDDIVKKVRVVLTIAQLDHDETNHDVQLDRLRALCQLCHLRYDAMEKYRRSMQSETLFP